ncbi:MAG: ABC transporter substrate-binding protein [Beijerinckiaceae bacterium]
MHIGYKGLAALALSCSLVAIQAARAEIKIGVTVSASGPGAALGQPEMKAVAGLPNEIAGEKITYIALDDESDGTKAAQNARKLIADEKVDALIGSSLTPTSLPLIDIAFETKTPLLTLAAAGAMVAPMDEKRKWVFKVVPNDALLITAVMNAIAKKGIKTLGYIGFSDAYGEGYYNGMAQMAPGLGIKLTTHEVYARNDTSVTGQILKIIATKPDAVFIAAAGTPAVLPQRALRERGYTGPVYQTHGVATEEFIKLGGKDVEGIIFAGEPFTIANDLPETSPFRKAATTYLTRYEAANHSTGNIFGAHLFDSYTLLEHAIPAALKASKPGTPEFKSALRDEIEKTKDLYLNNGLSNMTPTDHNGYEPSSIVFIKVEGGAFHLVK